MCIRDRAWAALSEKFGKLPLKTVLTPAIRTAREGYAVHSTAARLWAESFREYQAYAKKDEFHGWFETFAPKGRAPFAEMCIRDSPMRIH